jgi:Flp pilus assembly protein TadG
MQVVPLEPPRRLSGDTGSALIEAAIITPIFFYFMFGILELGLLMKNWITLGAAVQDGARSASIFGKDPKADWDIIMAVRDATSAIPTSQIKNLAVWKAAGPASTVPVACTSPSARTQVPNTCNVYTPTDDWGNTDPVTYPPLYNCTSPGWSSGYCPTTRKTAATYFLGNGPPDFVGITITINHKYLTGLFGTTKTVTETAITQLEPQTVA